MSKVIVLGLVVGVLIGLALLATGVLAEGTETIGNPGIAIAHGSGVAVGGVGLMTQPGTINVDVPADATVNQVLLYWSGEYKTNAANDNKLTVAGNVVTGTVIGGPTLFFTINGGRTDVTAVSYRVDITDLDLIGPGANAVRVSGMGFDHHNHGAGILAIYEEDDESAEIVIRDGSDLAYHAFESPLDTTVPQTFEIAAHSQPREAEFILFAGSVGEDRPNIIRVSEDGEHVFSLFDALGSEDGMYWDTLVFPIHIPAGVESVTVQILSADGDPKCPGLVECADPASLNWIMSSLVMPEKPTAVNLASFGVAPVATSIVGLVVACVVILLLLTARWFGLAVAEEERPERDDA